ncbi:MAG: D-alanine--D-alanine ligase [Actinomycetaceae bacterium]|nr:D-alanine--D-alanine ligase [Actinomycetaceae bacterium]
MNAKNTEPAAQTPKSANANAGKIAKKGTAKTMKVAVISGGLTPEHDVSIASGTRVANRLQRAGIDVKVFELGSSMLQQLLDWQPTVVWPLVHGSFGEDGTLQELLKLCGLAYLGTGPQGCRLSASKSVAKAVVAKNGLNTPAAVTLPQELFRQLGTEKILDRVETELGFPVMVKPQTGGSALGISKVDTRENLGRAMVNAFAYDTTVLVERFIPGRELAVSIIEYDDIPKALPVVEIHMDSGNYDYEARYTIGRSRLQAPAQLTADQLDAVENLAVSCHRVLELDQYSRIDIILDEGDTPWFIDANVAPGMTDTSLFPAAADAQEGRSFQDEVMHLVSLVDAKGPAEATDPNQ